MSIRVAIVEDHPFLAQAVASSIGERVDIEVVGQAGHGSQLMDLVRDTSPDVVVLDVGMPGGTFEPVSAVLALRQRYPQVKVLVFSGCGEAELMRQLVDAGVQGYVFKGDDLSMNLAECVRAVYEGRQSFSKTVLDALAESRGAAQLSEREMVIVRLIADGLSNVAIAQEIGLAEATVRNYVSGIYRKLGIKRGTVNPRMAVANKARKLGLLLS